jgi:formamidopyrimidine-DNA glycosylase
MPELPDVTVYVESLQRRIVGQPLTSVKFRSPFVLRTFDPPYSELQGKTVRDVSRQAKRLVFDFGEQLYMVMHLMRLGRLRWADPGKKAKYASGKALLATFEFPTGTLHLTETGTKKRAAIHVVRGSDAVADFDPGGLEVLEIDAGTFAKRLRRRNHTLKRALTDPRIFSGIGNAYSDEILWEAEMSPTTLTQKMSDEQVGRLYEAIRRCLTTWTDKLRDEVGEGWPEKVTAFRPEMAVHGKFKEPCPRCGAAVQRIAYSDRETNYCAQCQTRGKVLADRGLSRLLGKDWPKTLEELEELRRGSDDST